MIGLRPKFMDSPYFVPEFNNWHLLPGAPEEVVKEFEEFKKRIVEGLQEIYGDDARIETGVALRNNGSKYNGIRIFLKSSGSRVSPTLDLDRLYESFENGIINIEDCIWDICNSRTALSGFKDVERFVENISEWEYVKDDIYPVLLPTEKNQELLGKLVSTPILDLSVVYIIRRGIPGKNIMSIKITQRLMESYEITPEQLHRQAMINMKKDGYEFLDMESLIMEMAGMEGTIGKQDDAKSEMYILTNAARAYGAAGILNKELLQEFAGSRNFIILPSSLHEMIFVPMTDDTDQTFFDEMVKEVNRNEVSVEERLADHSYYYDSQAGEIRMCA